MQRVRDLTTSPAPAKWLFYGDSITHGALHTYGHRDYVELFAERIRYEMGRGMDVIINTAISGHNTRSLLAGYDWRVAQFQPHVVFIMIGMNDCAEGNGITPEEFRENLVELVRRNTELDAVTVLQTTCPILPGVSPERSPYLDTFMDKIRNVADELDLPLIDHTKFWREHPDSHYYWMNNAFHPNEYGHLAFAHLIFRELDIFDVTQPCCRMFLP